MSDDRKLRDRILSRWGALKQEREPFIDQWIEISRHITPSRGKFLPLGKSKNEARSRWNTIVDNTAARAAHHPPGEAVPRPGSCPA